MAATEFYHYGMPRRSGRYPWGSGERPFQSSGGQSKIQFRKQKLETRLTNRLDRIDRRHKRAQEIANKQYQKAVKKENSFFSRPKTIERAYEKATTAQRKANRYEFKASEYYKKTLKKLERSDQVMSTELKQRGLQYYENVIKNSKDMYQVMNMKLGKR